MSAYGRSAQGQREHDKLRYPGGDVLINKLGIRDQPTLEAAERYFVRERLAQGLPEDARAQSPEGLRAIHRHLFQDIYEWAGEFRRYTTGRGQAPFARPEFIEPELKRTFASLEGEGFLRGLDRAGFAERAAGYVNEINAAHPFVEGNGRVQRVWLRGLAEEAGYGLRFQQGESERQAWNRASEIGFYRTDAPMAELIGARLTPLREQSRGQDARQILLDRYEASVERGRSGRPDRSKDLDQADED